MHSRTDRRLAVCIRRRAPTGAASSWRSGSASSFAAAATSTCSCLKMKERRVVNRRRASQNFADLLLSHVRRCLHTSDVAHILTRTTFNLDVGQLRAILPSFLPLPLPFPLSPSIAINRAAGNERRDEEIEGNSRYAVRTTTTTANTTYPPAKKYRKECRWSVRLANKSDSSSCAHKAHKRVRVFVPGQKRGQDLTRQAD